MTLTECRISLIISYKTGGGMGEHDAIEEGLRSMIENPDHTTRFKIESWRDLGSKEVPE